jgi:hypothetical protein
VSDDGAPRSLGGVRETSLKQAARQLGDTLEPCADGRIRPEANPPTSLALLRDSVHVEGQQQTLAWDESR